MNVWIIEVFNEGEKAGFLTDCFYSKNHALDWAAGHAEQWTNVRSGAEIGCVIRRKEFSVVVISPTHSWTGTWAGKQVRSYKVTRLVLHGGVVDALADRAPGPSIFERLRRVFA